MTEACLICLIADICDPSHKGHVPQAVAFLANCPKADSIEDLKEVRT